MKNILSVQADAKTSKGVELGFLTGILYLAPHTSSGVGNTCPMAKVAQCHKACLYTAGRGAMNSVQKARIAKTERFFNDREAFIGDIVYSIKALIRKAEREGLTPLVRLNGTSDISWENIKVGDYNNIFEAFPNVQFYDYTKIPNRDGIPLNYDLTFSYSGVEGWQKHVERAKVNINLRRIAVVFSHRERAPRQFNGWPVVDGDNTDVRHLDGSRTIVGLYAKGKAVKDKTGFVVQV